MKGFGSECNCVASLVSLLTHTLTHYTFTERSLNPSASSVVWCRHALWVDNSCPDTLLGMTANTKLVLPCKKPQKCKAGLNPSDRKVSVSPQSNWKHFQPAELNYSYKQVAAYVCI